MDGGDRPAIGSPAEPISRTCKAPGCGKDISHKRRGAFFCDSNCKSDYHNHEAAEARSAAPDPAKLPIPDTAELASELRARGLITYEEEEARDLRAIGLGVMRLAGIDPKEIKA
ncbi:hypothetical protein J4G43_005010 [Bradyrhizobium barranii subsp. barranii]|uniref:Uncharacterized protein n=1 Tax=Bradyrhizobium barranii subsp. barranii TaxID=2823807 RepID=A0A939RZ56_9BRAD|nr:hypothetical protein [Bradyrhizobium barranii]UEM13683.1 hypothetical protein J4G43_005010 [Bradyrhizobium barranii subsp. barranii]